MSRRTLRSVLALSVALISSHALAQPPDSVVLQLNRVVSYSTSNPFTKAVPGNVKILDVVPVTDREVILQPQSVGSTNILFLDAHGEILANIDVRVDDPVEIGRHGVELHNVPQKLGNAAYYRCSAIGCVLDDETIMRATPVLQSAAESHAPAAAEAHPAAAPSATAH
jgi:hypothetical protein